jgi:hypothetical protein
MLMGVIWQNLRQALNKGNVSKQDDVLIDAAFLNKHQYVVVPKNCFQLSVTGIKFSISKFGKMNVYKINPIATTQRYSINFGIRDKCDHILISSISQML